MSISTEEGKALMSSITTMEQLNDLISRLDVVAAGV